MRQVVSERARDRAVGRLQAGYACGVLGTETFERRLDAALTASSPAVLRDVTGDLVPPSVFERARRWLTSVPADGITSGLLEGLVANHPAIIGRARSCDLVLGDESVSRRHAMLVRSGGRTIVTDLGSTNGTLLNGRVVMQAEVRPGDHLRLGDVDLLL